jgi:hypothetical protein
MTSINKKKIPSRQALKYNFLYSQHVFSSENRKGELGILIGHVGYGAERRGERYTAKRSNEETSPPCHSREGGNPGLREMAAAEFWW